MKIKDGQFKKVDTPPKVENLSVNNLKNEIIEIEEVDISSDHLERMAKEYFVGGSKRAIGRRQDVRKLLEDKVVRRIGKNGKYLVDKLFELIEGVYILTKDEPNEKKYYKIPPSLNAIIYALDRVLGKPKQVNVQASFSLSKLLVSVDKNESTEEYVKADTLNGFRPDDNDEIQEKPDIFYRESLETGTPAY